MRRPHLVVVWVVAVAVLMLSFAVVWKRQFKADPKVPLGDGTTLQIEKLTWGTNQIFYAESRWWTALKLQLPPKLRNLVGVPVGPYQFDPLDRFPLIGLSRLDPTSGDYLDSGSYWYWMVDSSGMEFEQWSGMGNPPGPGSSATRFEVLDWRAKVLRFRVKTDSWTREFEIPNPRRGERFPEWIPSPMPHAIEVEGFTGPYRAATPRP